MSSAPIRRPGPVGIYLQWVRKRGFSPQIRLQKGGPFIKPDACEYRMYLLRKGEMVATRVVSISGVLGSWKDILFGEYEPDDE